MFKSQTTTLISCIAMLVVGCGLIIWSMQSDAAPGADGVYYYDLNTQKVFVGPSEALAPIDTESGPYQKMPAGVRIYIYTCGESMSFTDMTLDELKAAGGFPAWLEMYSPEAKHAAANPTPGSDTIVMGGQLNRAIDGDRWYPAFGSHASQIRKSSRDVCGGETAVLINP